MVEDKATLPPFYSPGISPSMPQSLGLRGFKLERMERLQKEPFFIGICGGSCSGKSQVTERLKSCLNFAACVINEFDFYIPSQDGSTTNYDDPTAIDWTRMLQTFQALCEKRPVDYWSYNMKQHAFAETKTRIFPTPVVIVEGLFILNNSEVRSYLDMKIFVDCPEDIRLGNRVRKYTSEYEYELGDIIEYYLASTKPAYEEFIEPVSVIQSKRCADIIIPNYGTEFNDKSVEFMMSHVAQLVYGGSAASNVINRLRYRPLS